MSEDFIAIDRRLNNCYDTGIHNSVKYWKQQLLRSTSDRWKDKCMHCSVSLWMVSELKRPELDQNKSFTQEI